MKTALLATLAALAAATPAAALEVHPEPGMNLDPTSFTDLRVVLGIAAPVLDARAAEVVYEADLEPGPHLALQWVHGTAGDGLGAAIGLELAYDEHKGSINRATGVQTIYGTGDTSLRAVTLGLLPKLVLRPDYDDPFDWGPGSVHVELGPVLAAGFSKARIGGSPLSDSTLVLQWGFRVDVLWTADSRWQGGLSLGWEGFTASPDDLADDASISGSGLCGGLIFGRRL